MKITKENLVKNGFECVDNKNWSLQSKNHYDVENKCWTPSFKVTISVINNNWEYLDCLAWYATDLINNNEYIKQVRVLNIETIEDIQNVMNICHIPIILNTF